MQRDIALTCRNKYCKQTTATHNVHYIYQHNTTTHNAPVHCPMCAASNDTPSGIAWINTRRFDYADTLCIKFPMLPRPLASALLDNYNNTLTATRSRTHTLTVDGITVSSVSTVNVPCQFKSVEDMITEVLPAKLTTSSSITPIHVKCNDCLSTVTILRTNPTAIATMPKFCIWCSSTNLSITLPSTDETATLVLNLDLIEQQTVQELATKYNIPLLVMQALYDQWSAQSRIRTIADWMQTPAVQKVIRLISSRSNL